MQSPLALQGPENVSTRNSEALAVRQQVSGMSFLAAILCGLGPNKSLPQGTVNQLIATYCQTSWQFHDFNIFQHISTSSHHFKIFQRSFCTFECLSMPFHAFPCLSNNLEMSLWFFRRPRPLTALRRMLLSESEGE